ncbi:MAG: HAMP domain-containing histidine kinase [Clostridia bacterium]|nr:HAMP domain-containing histidine kinase [Clostridia bacterium]
MIKKYIRTTAAKVILFIFCIVSLCALTLSVFGAVFMIGENFYTKTQQEIFYDLIHDELRSEGYSLLWRLNGDHYQFVEDRSNLIYEILDESGNSLDRSSAFGQAETEPYSFSFQYGILKDRSGTITDIYYHDYGERTDEIAVYYTFNVQFKSGLPQWDTYALAFRFTQIAYSLRYTIYGLIAIALLTTIGSFITLMCISARKPHTQDLCPGPLNRVPFDLMLAFALLLGVCLIYLVDYFFYEDLAIVLLTIIGCLLFANVALGLCMSIAARVKQKTLLKNTVVYYCLRFLGKTIRKAGHFTALLFQSLPLIWRTALLLVGLSLIEFLVLAYTAYDPGALMLYWLLEKLILVPIVLYIALALRNLQKAGDALAKGDLGFQTETNGMFWDFKQHGKNLNSIAKGMTLAVEDRLKSERMKTELITNVSHDLKTPLTSIINYASLIDNEPCDNAHIKEYSAVLVRQSERLKRLIEDLVEASKASTGNLEVRLAACDASIFLAQAGGEYAEKLESAGLTLIIKHPDTPIKIMADGRRMWRIFDNLMNNICKYAQSGTRVYLSLETVGNNAVICFKNTSRDPLDMTEEELIERFVRGDASRNTEGNGLGLSIAKSLAELQNGSLKLEIDGDLFKAILTFPRL